MTVGVVLVRVRQRNETSMREADGDFKQVLVPQLQSWASMKYAEQAGNFSLDEELCCRVDVAG